MRRFVLVALLVLGAFAVDGSARASASDPFAVDLVACDAGGGTMTVPPDRALELVGPAWTAKTRGLVNDFLRGSTTTLTLGSASASAGSDYAAASQTAAQTWSTTWRHALPALTAGARLDVALDVRLDHQMPDVLASGRPLLLDRGLRFSVRCALVTGIGAAGGTVRSGDVVVAVPAGALATETAITIAASNATPPADLGGQVGAAYDLGPSGTTFAVPVTITLPYDPAALAGRPASLIRVATMQNGTWGVIAATVNEAAHTVSAQVTHFTPYVPTISTGISGTITNTSGTPIANAGVAAFDAATCTEILSTETTTDGSGKYALALAAGTYYVGARDVLGGTALIFYGQGPICDLATNVAVASGSVTTGIDIALGDAYIYGNVHQAPFGPGIPGVTVTAYSGATAVDSTTTKADSVYLLKLGNGSFTLRFQPPAGQLLTEEWYDNAAAQAAATPITLAGNHAFIAVELTRRGISGLVTDADTAAGVSGATLTIYDGAQNVVASTTTNSAGSYEVYLADGTYSVRAERSGYQTEYWNDKASLALANPVTVNGAVASANFALTARPTLSGTVTDAATSAAIRDIGVLIYDNSCVLAARAQTTASGTYAKELAQGTYRVFFQSWDGKYLDKWNGGTSCATATAMTINANTTLNVSLSPAPIAFNGTVTDAGGAPVSNATVRVWVGGSNRCCAFAASTTTGLGGTFTVAPGAAGSYRIEVVPPAGSGLFERWAGSAGSAAEFKDAPDLVFTNTLPVKVDLSLPSGAHTIRGTVKDTAMTALGNSLVVGFKQTTATDPVDARASTIADATGGYQLSVPSASWIVVAQPPPGHVVGFRGGIDSSTDPVGVDLFCASGSIISGRVTDALSGAGVPSIHVAATDWSGGAGAVSDDNFTDSSGDFALTVANGDYRIHFETLAGVAYPRAGYVDAYWNGKSTFAAANKLTIAGANASGINASLAPLFSVTGTVSTSSPFDPSAIRVEAVDTATCTVVMAYGYTLPSGTYEMRLPNGSYKFRTAGRSDWTDAWYGGTSCGTALPVPVNGGNVGSIDMTVTHIP
ncbi:MAG TPA: carboxypeptidase regulatory-like domain-containing protein [Candidatus Limnocylindria bacterium]|nr:carboxypeptidase regulatory-like domain-containing protein [Candidatus Limnocylindria bacterium]